MAVRVAFVTGSRNFRSPGLLFDWLDGQRRLSASTGSTLVVMHGACPEGADEYAHTWVKQAMTDIKGGRIYEQADPALWNGKNRTGAGPVRNARQAQRLKDYREEGGVVIRVAVCHWLPSLDDIARERRSGTGSQVRQLRNHGIPDAWMTYLEDD
jgi:hypothetical protein